MKSKKPMSMRKIVRMLRKKQPDTDSRIALFCYQRMNEAVRELQRVIASDKADKRLEWRQ